MQRNGNVMRNMSKLSVSNQKLPGNNKKNRFLGGQHMRLIQLGDTLHFFFKDRNDLDFKDSFNLLSELASKVGVGKIVSNAMFH